MAPSISFPETPETGSAPMNDEGLLLLDLKHYSAKRKVFLQGQWGTAAVSHSAQFKRLLPGNKPASKRWDHRLTQEASSRKGSSLKHAARFLGNPGLISLGGGLPSSEYFPFESLCLEVPLLPGPNGDGNGSSRETSTLRVGKSDLAEGKSKFDIATALNYGQGGGSAQLIRWVTEHTELFHRPPYRDWACTMTVGSTSALDMALRMFTRPGDAILSEEYTFATAVETAAPMGVGVVGVSMDEEGLLPQSLDHILSGWDVGDRGGRRKPFVLYTVPSGQNPTGATQSASRRRELYRVAQKHDLYILEDEPYYYLQMPPYSPGGSSSRGEDDDDDGASPTIGMTHEQFLASLVPSLLSLDTDGRVMRMDSFSKVVAPGLRTGWVTASEQVVDRYRQHAELSTQSPSGASQLLLFKLLDYDEGGWGHAGFVDWLMHVRAQYTRRRDAMLRACDEFLPGDIVTWTPPTAGMFLWLRVDWKRHPKASTLSLREIEQEIFDSCIKHGVLAMCGSWFCAEQDTNHDNMFFRVTFAAATFDKLREATRRLGDAVRESFGTL